VTPGLAILLLLAAAMAPGEAPAPVDDDPRGRVIVRRDCTTELGHAEITLFANGTVRYREGERRREEMLLAELPPDELQAFLRRLEEVDLAETEAGRAEVKGGWVESCVLELRLADRPERSFGFGRFDSLSLALSRLLAVVDELTTVAKTRHAVKGLPRGYRPRPGDILARSDGSHWEVVSLTSDGRGAEIQGVDDPLTVYMALDAIVGEFVAVVKRRTFP
jgi:hypothetical protein